MTLVRRTTFILTMIISIKVLGQTSEPEADSAGIGSILQTDPVLTAVQQVTPSAPAWKVSPAAEPVPVFRYRFWPRESELKPGSGQLYYFRAVTKLHQNEGALAALRQISNRDDQATPDVREFVASLDSVFRELKMLAFLEDVTWDHRMRDLEGPDIYDFALDDVQVSRDLARLLMINARIHLADRNFDRASECVLIGLRLAYLIGQGESVIQSLVGCGLQAMMRLIIEEMIQTPGCPNLYWAIATIPQPLISIRRSVELELSAIHKAFPDLRQAATAGWSQAEADQKLVDALKLLRELSGSETDAQERNTQPVVDYANFVPSSRLRLLAAGIPEQQLAQMAPAAIVMADTANELDRLIDETIKALLVPGPQKDVLLRLREAGFQEVVRFANEPSGTGPVPSPLGLFAAPLFPSIRQLDAAADRTPIMLRRLMTLEAIRCHAAANGGKLPVLLNDVKVLPVVFAFSTEQPFEYRLETDGDVSVGVLSGKIPSFPTAEQLRFQIVP